MTIKIGWQKYRISFQRVVKAEDDQTLYGHQLGSAGVLKISTVYGNPRAKSCLIHEIIHAIDEQYVIGLKEEQTEALANGIMAAIVDNKEQTKDFIEWCIPKSKEK